MNLESLEIKEWLGLNAKLQSKKNSLRKALKEKGVLQKQGKNEYDRYNYFSEAQYKALFTELFSEHNLELKFNELEYDTFDGAGKQSNGRMPKLEFTLFDCETGFFEKTVITGEGMDKGDKAGYKAYTGALKYYLANTFMVATGDDQEKDSLSENMNKKAEQPIRKATKSQIETILQIVNDIPKMLEYYHINSVEELNIRQASEIIKMKGSNKHE